MYLVPRPSRFQIKTDEMWEVILLSFRLTVALAVTELIQLHFNDSKQEYTYSKIRKIRYIAEVVSETGMNFPS